MISLFSTPKKLKPLAIKDCSLRKHELDAFRSAANGVFGNPRFRDPHTRSTWDGLSSAGRGGHVRIIPIVNWPYDHMKDNLTTADFERAQLEIESNPPNESGLKKNPLYECGVLAVANQVTTPLTTLANISKSVARIAFVVPKTIAKTARDN